MAEPTGTPTSAPRADYTKDDQRTAKAKDRLQKCIDDARLNYTRLDRDKSDWLNLLYYRGGVDNHWVVWDRSQNAWVPRPYDGESGAALPDWVPRAATNIFAKKIDGIVALQDQSNPALEWVPATDDSNDQAAANVIDESMPALMDEIGYQSRLRSQLHRYVTLMDKVAVFVYFDADPRYGTSTLQMLRCPTCNDISMPADAQDQDQCPNCGAPYDDMEPAVDQNFQPMGPEAPTGKLCARAIPSFEFSLPRSAREADERTVAWILLHTRYSKEDALACWGKNPKARKIIEDERETRYMGQSQLQRQYADAMARLVAPSASRHGNVAGGALDNLGPVVYIVQHDPDEDFPEGLHAVMIGDELVEAGPLPVKDDQGHPRKSILIRTYQHAPGAPYGKPPADDMVPLQYWRNLIESLLALTLLHNAAPRTFIPMSVVLEDEITGIPGQQVRFRSMVPGERPITEPGANPPEGLYKYLELLDQKFEEISGLNAVLMGNRPTGDPTLGEVQILQERGMAAFKTPLDMLVDFEKRLAILVLQVARQSAWAPRFRKIRGEHGQWEVDQFAMTDIEGSVDVICEPATAWPRSPLMENLKLKEAVGMGVVMPAQDPELASKVLSMMDLSRLKPSMDADRKQIARQLDRWKKASDPQQILSDPVQPAPWMGVASLNLHWMLKSEFLKSESAEELAVANPPVYQAMLQAVSQIQQLIQMLTAPPPQAAPPPPQKGGKPEAPQKPQPGAHDDALGHMVQQGVLQPAGPGAQAAQQQAQAPPRGPSIDDLLMADLLRPLPPHGGEFGDAGAGGNGNGAGGGAMPPTAPM